jgi:hypothetical protein
VAQPAPSALEAAERLLGRPSRDLVGRRLWTRLIPAALPDGLPALPLPPDLDLIGSSVRMYERHIMSVDVMLDAAQWPEELLASFNATLPGLGWSPAPNATSGQGLTTVPVMGTGAVTTLALNEYCQSENGPYMRASMYPRADGGSSVQLHLEIAETDRCLRQRRSSVGALHGEMIPPLTGPNRLNVTFTGGRMGGTEATAQATLATDLPADQLEHTFAEQLAAAAWTRRTGGADGTVTWSLWSLPDYGDWQALVVLVPAASPGNRTLLVRLKSWREP